MTSYCTWNLQVWTFKGLGQLLLKKCGALFFLMSFFLLLNNFYKKVASFSQNNAQQIAAIFYIVQTNTEGTKWDFTRVNTIIFWRSFFADQSIFRLWQMKSLGCSNQFPLQQKEKKDSSYCKRKTSEDIVLLLSTSFQGELPQDIAYYYLPQKSILFSILLCVWIYNGKATSEFPSKL